MAIRNRLGMLAVENDLDFLSVTDEKGNILARAFVPQAGERKTFHPIR